MICFALYAVSVEIRHITWHWLETSQSRTSASFPMLRGEYKVLGMALIYESIEQWKWRTCFLKLSKFSWSRIIWSKWGGYSICPPLRYRVNLVDASWYFVLANDHNNKVYDSNGDFWLVPDGDRRSVTKELPMSSDPHHIFRCHRHQ